jgi:hypothetical protein
VTKTFQIWSRAPHGPIPKAIQDRLRNRLQRHVRTRWKDHCREVRIRFRGAYAYVEAFPLNRQYMPWITQEQRALIDATPTRLCRLGYLGNDDQWQYAFYKYSDEKYALSVVASGSFEAMPEEAFDCSAEVYLRE